MSARAATATAALAGFVGILALPTAAEAAPQHDAPVVVAHRGASGYAPENTLQAIDKARELGFDWVENDVQRTKDGRLVVIHDTNLARTTNVEQIFPGRAPYNVGDFTAAEIAKLDAGSWKGAEFTGARVPTLTQYLDRVDHNHQKLLMEIKAPELYPGIEKDVLRELGKEGWLNRDHIRNHLVIQSFSADSVRTVHERRPDITTGFLGTPDVSELPRYAQFADQINPSNGTISDWYVAAVHAFKGPHHKRLKLFTWTVNDAAAARRAAGLGVDGIITNVPDAVRKAVGGRE
ncbi:glycerophosphodiester phosphodiesterase [Streptomyces longhuiensis]|uniref:glycerophosphodiester phosphodiesterase n=1 Tax=Streptomyces longhuiensis TaxID=2880933 RepID=UPI001D0A4470|nr:glycerophosphodiester phosphodiesterase family protein [Streptomyces longhuiensis]UDL99211.1 glycerophosphodiester phosphodiesterase [Streptomyces longhuiensis]